MSENAVRLCQRAGGLCGGCPADRGCYVRGTAQRPVLCCHCPDVEEYLAEASGLGLDVYWRQPELPALPAEVELLRDFTPHGEAAFYAASLNSLYSENLCVPRWNARAALGIGEEAGLWVMGNARDGLLEALWARRSYGAWEALRCFAPVLVTTPDFSVYRKEPVLECYLNQKRSLVSGFHLYSLGLTPVVTLLYSDLGEVLRWADWLDCAGWDQHTVAVNAQGILRGEAWEDWLAGLTLLAASGKRGRHWIVAGVYREERRAQVRAAVRAGMSNGWSSAGFTFVSATGLQKMFGKNGGRAGRDVERVDYTEVDRETWVYPRTSLAYQVRPEVR